MNDWLPPILFMLIWISPLTDEHRARVAEWCTAQTPGAELAIYDVNIPGPERMTIRAKQMVCFAPKAKAQ